MITTAIFVVAVAAFIRACVDYARLTWHTNSDLMGASLAFTLWWILGTVSAGFALLRDSLLSAGRAAVVLVFVFVLGKVVEWFVIERTLLRWFKHYRKHSE